jgi:hypothetical protein
LFDSRRPSRRVVKPAFAVSLNPASQPGSAWTSLSGAEFELY